MTDTNQEVRETPELLPCPFCGAPGFIEEGSTNQNFMAGCIGCQCNLGERFSSDGGAFHMFKSGALAAEAWNTRAALASAPPPAVPDAVGVRAVIGSPEWCDKAERSEWAFMAKMLAEAIEYIRPVNLSGLGVAKSIAEERANSGWRAFAALSFIEPTPSPEPQDSNAGAVHPAVMRALAEYLSQYRSGPPEGVALQRWAHGVERALSGVVDERHYVAALSTPEPQTGERDEALLREQRRHFLTAQAAEALVQNLCRERNVARECHAHALDLAKKEIAARETAERRLAEAERAERARLFDLFERDPEQFTALCASNAALRAKPEAQAIVGNEAGE